MQQGQTVTFWDILSIFFYPEQVGKTPTIESQIKIVERYWLSIIVLLNDQKQFVNYLRIQSNFANEQLVTLDDYATWRQSLYAADYSIITSIVRYMSEMSVSFFNYLTTQPEYKLGGNKKQIEYYTQLKSKLLSESFMSHKI